MSALDLILFAVRGHIPWSGDERPVEPSYDPEPRWFTTALLVVIALVLFGVLCLTKI
jgi:hypothetical protein